MSASEKAGGVSHTPGPWYDWGDDEVPSGIPVIEIGAGMIGEPNRKQIAYVQPSDAGDDDEGFPLFEQTPEDRANARLIAAAPDLLEALETICEKLTRAGAANSKPFVDARAALAKARGQS